MADMLRFRKGTYAQIQAAEKAPGTIYIAKDEKAMYVDVSASERIRIGDFIRVDTVKDITPPYSTSSLYYVEADNALLKYNGSEWKQVNGTDDLTDRIGAVETTVSGHTTTLSTHGTDIANLKTTVGTQGTDIEALKAAVGMNEEGEVEGLAGTVAQLRTDLDALDGEVDGLSSKLTAAEGNISKNATDISKVAGDLATHAQEAEANYAKKNDVYAKSQTYSKTEADNAISVAVAAEAAIAREAESANSLAAAAAQSAADEAKRIANGKIDEAGVKALGYVTKVDAEAYTDGKITAEVSRADAKYATQTALGATNEVVAGHTTAISGINTALESVVTKSELEGKNYATTGQVATAKQEAIDAAASAAADIYATKTALESTNEAVSAAQLKANQAYTLAGEKTTAAEVKTQIEAYGYATTGQVATAKQEAIDAAKTAGDKAYAAKAIEQTVAGHTSSLTTLTGAATVAGSVAEAKKAGDDAQADIDAWVNAHSSDYTNSKIDELVADAKKAGTDAAATAGANATTIAGHATRIKSLEDNSATKSELAQAKTDLEQTIADEINAANAMEYAGGVGSQTDLDKVANVKKGTTYVVTAKFGNYYPGDLLIATGTEVNGVIADPDWTRVQTGYDATLEQKLETKDGKIQLSSITGANNGQLEFVADAGSAASVSVANNKVTIGMVWEDF